LRTRLTDTLARYLTPNADHPTYPAYAGAVLLASINATVIAHEVVGHALRYGASQAELPPAQRVQMRPDSIFDLASITKVFTALLVLQQAERGSIDLSAPVDTYLPEFTGAGKDAATVAMLLTHTSGLPSGMSLANWSTVADRRAAILSTALVSGAVPGRVFRYSDLSMIVLGLILERVTGQPLDKLVKAGLTGPLGLRSTGFTPLTWLPTEAHATRLVATQATSARGPKRGVVHDPTAYALGGVAGNAGLFSTADDLLVVGQMLLDGGQHAGTRILSEATVRRMLTNANTGVPAVDPYSGARPGWSSAQGLGIRLNQPWFMGRLASPLTFGHTGFTGTSLVVDPRRRLVLVLLTNSAHPNPRRANPDRPRASVANVLADTIPTVR
jgi:CubicO group peptidase (beta-lactamase class C family)